MVIYIVFSLLCMWLAYIHDFFKDKQLKFFISIVLFFLIAGFMGLRYGVGQDYFFTYVPSFEKISSIGYDYNVEYGWNIFNKLCASIVNDYALMFFISAIVFITLIFLSIKQYDMSICMSILIFIIGGYYFYSFNVMRQCITISFFIYSLKFVRNKRIISYIVINLIGASIHKSGYIYLPIYFVLDKDLKNKYYIIALILVFLSRFILAGFVSKVLIGTKYENYITGYYSNTTSDKITASQIINILLFILYTVVPPIDDTDKNRIIFKNIHFFGLVFTLFVGIIPLMFRMTTLFYLIQFVSVPYFYHHYIKKKYKIVVSLLIVVVYSLLFIHTIINNGNNIIPYRFIWERG